MRQSLPRFVYFCPFHITIKFELKKSKRRCCAGDLNQGLQDGRCRQIHLGSYGGHHYFRNFLSRWQNKIHQKMSKLNHLNNTEKVFLLTNASEMGDKLLKICSSKQWSLTELFLAKWLILIPPTSGDPEKISDWSKHVTWLATYNPKTLF